MSSESILVGISGLFIGLIAGIIVVSLGSVSKLSDMRTFINHLIEEKASLEKKITELRIKLRNLESRSD